MLNDKKDAKILSMNLNNKIDNIEKTINQSEKDLIEKLALSLSITYNEKLAFSSSMDGSLNFSRKDNGQNFIGIKTKQELNSNDFSSYLWFNRKDMYNDK